MNQKSFKQLYRFISSMGFGLLLLGLLCMVTLIGSLIPQGRDASFYQQNFTTTQSRFILEMGLDNLYQAWYFLLLWGLLCINLFCCSIVRLGKVFNRMKSLPNLKGLTLLETISVNNGADRENMIKKKFTQWGFPSSQGQIKEDKICFYSRRNSVGYLGSWLLHLGVLFTIFFYGFGQFTYFTTAAYGVSGSTVAIEGTDFLLSIDDFYIDYRKDNTIEQYYTELTLLNGKGERLKEQKIFVNQPLGYEGYNIYQTATGWSGELEIKRKGIPSHSQLLYEGTTFIDEESKIALQFNKFFPDFIMTSGGPMTRSPFLENPMILYSLFERGQRVDMNFISPEEGIIWGDYEFVLKNPKMYTYMQVNKMKGKPGAAIGAAMIMLGAILAFYVKPKILLIENKGNKLLIYGNDNGIALPPQIMPFKGRNLEI